MKTTEFKLSFLNLFPFGLLGMLPKTPYLSILWGFKIYRIKLFLMFFDYYTYHPFFKGIMKLRLEFINYVEGEDTNPHSLTDKLKL